MASFERNSPSNLSMREKSRLKQRINKQHSSNFHAGYVPIHEDHLHKIGIRGRKIYCFYIVIIFLLILAIANLILTAILLVVLKIDHTGMEALEFIIPGRRLRFRQEVDLGVLRPFSNSINGQNLTITGNNQQVLLKANNQVTHSEGSISIGPSGIKIKINESMKVINPANGKVIFSTDFHDFKMPSKLKVLRTNLVKVEKVTSNVGDDLQVYSNGGLTMMGNEGIYFDSNDILISTNGLLNLTSDNSIIIDGASGIQTDLPNIDTRFFNPSLLTDSPTYKLCICLPSGYVFMVPIIAGKGGCQYANEIENPCPQQKQIITKRRPFPF